MDKDILEKFLDRLHKFNIHLDLVYNYPWIYIDKINGKKVTENFQADHGFTIAFLPIRLNQKMKLSDTTEIFKLIKKYTNHENKSTLVD